MRMRMLKPEFWEDETIQKLSAETRLFYQGLWLLADDAGYFKWDENLMRIKLQAYASQAVGARRVRQGLAALVELGKVKELACGRHGVAPNVPVHQTPGRPMYRIRELHRRQCSGVQTANPFTKGSKTEQSLQERGKGIGEGEGEGDEVFGTKRTTKSRLNTPRAGSREESTTGLATSFDEAMPGLRQKLKAAE